MNSNSSGDTTCNLFWEKQPLILKRSLASGPLPFLIHVFEVLNFRCGVDGWGKTQAAKLARLNKTVGVYELETNENGDFNLKIWEWK